MRRPPRYGAYSAARRYRSPAARRYSRPHGRRPSRARWWLLLLVPVVGSLVAASVWLPRAKETTDHWVVLSTTRTTTDGAFDFPKSLKKSLADFAEEEGHLEDYRADGAGTLTPATDVTLIPKAPDGTRTNDQRARADAVTTSLADEITRVRTPVGEVGGRSLFTALQHLALPKDARLLLISSGLDTAEPLDFRRLAWRTAPATVAANLGDRLPSLPGARITFLFTPTAGPQQQLTAAAREYRQAAWSAVLTKAGASTVDFVDAVQVAEPDDDKDSPTPTAPAIALPDAGSTPQTCEIGDTAFVADAATFLDRAAAVEAVRACLAGARAAEEVRVDAWTSYAPPLRAAQQRSDQRLSLARARAVRDLLRDQGVPSAVIRVIGHGSKDQPHPDSPESGSNRIARVLVIPRT